MIESWILDDKAKSPPLQDELQSGRVAYSLLTSEAGEAGDHI